MWTDILRCPKTGNRLCIDQTSSIARVGTGVFTAPLYRRYPNATIIGVDCSMNMLRKARVRFQEHGVLTQLWMIRSFG